MNERLSDAEEMGKKILVQIATSTTHEQVERLTSEYVKARYFLEDEDMLHDSLNALGHISIARTTGMNPLDLLSLDLNAKCDSSSPALAKKILLMITLNRELGLGISPDQAADITTVSELAAHISKVILEKDHQSNEERRCDKP